MFWADRLAGEIIERFGKEKPIRIRDEKTLSGQVHIGSLRGVAIHGAISEALTDAGVANTYTYEFNDFDPMDGIPSYLDQATYIPYLGMPLKNIPSPEPGYENFAEYYGAEFEKVIEKTGYKPEFYRSSELYLSGKMDGVIRTALERAGDIRRIYKEVSGGERKEDWLPISVLCPTCGKLSTTLATDFDGETVHTVCRDLDWVKGCGFTGRVSPFGGNAKLPWKVEWPAKWVVMEVMVEGAGKDHSTKGGARDVANHIAKEVFEYEPPFDVPYEFFLVGGQKMSSSKGRGSSAKAISDLVSAKILRLALIGKEIMQAFNFDPQGDTIPVLYDLYDKLAVGYRETKDDDYARLFEFIHPGRKLPPENVFLPRFSQIAFLTQMKHLNIEVEAARLKGAPLTDADMLELAERAEYAQYWIQQCAPEKFVFTLQQTLPEAAKELSHAQKQALKVVYNFIENADGMPSGEDIQQKLHGIKEEMNIAPAELFSALYLAFLGKTYGPKVGWFLSVLDKNFVLKRLEEVSN